LVDVAGPAPDLDSHLDLDRAIRTLPRRQRIAVEMYYVLGLPVAEIAQVMGCAVGTVSSTLSDARRSLRARLEVS
jgi:RNA polymerase sigma-70 factor (ECF subfamily)